MEEWKLHLFGEVAVTGEAERFAQFETSRSAKLLALLALSGSGRPTRAALGASLWPDEFPDVIRLRFRQELARLRRALGPAESILLADKEQVGLDRSVVTIDLEELRQAAAWPDDAPRLTERLQALVSRAQGEFLPGWDDPWVLGERRHALDLRAKVALRLGHRLLAQCDAAGALAAVQDAIRFDPTHEPLRLVAVKAKAMMGSLTGALAEFHDLKHAIEKGAGTLTTQAHDVLTEIQSGALPAAAPAPVGPKFPTLPAPVDRLVGRDAEVVKVAELLEAGARLVTLAGPGGIGKTRLALEVAQQLQARRPVVFVSLEDVGEATQIVDAILAALGLRIGSETESFSYLAHTLPAETLVVLDNLEHLEEGGVREVSRLLEKVGSLSVLATSRRPLRLAGEATLSLGPLAPEASLRLLTAQRAGAEDPALAAVVAALDGYPLALQLAASQLRLRTPGELARLLGDSVDFLESRGAATPDRHRTIDASLRGSFAGLSPEDGEAIRQIAAIPGPWGTEFAHALLGDVALDRIEALLDAGLLHLEDQGQLLRFRVLGPIRQALRKALAPEAQAAIEQAYAASLQAQLSDVLPTVFGPMSFEGRARLDADIHGYEWLARTQGMPARLGAYLAAQGRGSEVVAALSNAMGEEAAARGLALNALGRDAEAALAFELAAEGLTGDLQILAQSHAALSRRRESPVQAYESILPVLERARKEGGEYARMTTLFHAGTLGFFINRFDDATQFFEEAFAMAEASRLEYDLAIHSQKLANVYMARGQVARAEALLVKNRDRLYRTGDLPRIANYHEVRGITHVERGEFEDAEREFRQSLAYWESLQNDYQVTDQCQSLAFSLIRQGRTREALEMTRRAALGWHRMADYGGFEFTLSQRAELALQSGDEALARTCLATAQRLHAKYNLVVVDGHARYQQRLVDQLGGVDLADGTDEPDVALGYF